MKVIEVVKLKAKDVDGLKRFMMLKYGAYEDKKTGALSISRLLTARGICAQSEESLLSKLALKHNVSLITGKVNFPVDSHGTRQRGCCVEVTGDLNPLLLEVEKM